MLPLLFLLAGVSQESLPPDGTWWESPQAASFHQRGFTYGAGVRGGNWSFTVERMGKMTSAAVACAADEPACVNGKPYSHWYGSEHPVGAWGALEPHYGPVFAQAGLGVVWPQFDMVIPDWNGRLLVVGNNRAVVSPLVGIGYGVKNIDFVINWRLVRAVNSNIDFQGLGWNVLSATVHINF